MPNRHILFSFSLIAGVVVACLLLAAPAEEVADRKASIHKVLLKCYLAKRKMPDALNEYQIILGHEPSNARMHFDYGNALMTVGDKRRALDEFQTCDRLQPNVPEYQGAVRSLQIMLKQYVQPNPSRDLKLRLDGDTD